MIIKQEYIVQIRLDDDLLYKLAKANGCRVRNIEKWLRENNKMLTTAGNLVIIKNHLQISETSELLEETIAAGK